MAEVSEVSTMRDRSVPLEQLSIEAILEGADVRGPDDCWEWQRLAAGSMPSFHVNGSRRSVRRAVYAVLSGDRNPPNVTPSCGNDLCVNPAHIVTYSEGDRSSQPSELQASKLTASDAVAIRQRAAAGETHRSIAEDYGISRGHASSIIRGERWPDAGGPIADDSTNPSGGQGGEDG